MFAGKEIVKEFIVTDKYLDIMSVGLRNQVSLLVFEGTIRSIKTVSAIQLFFERVQSSDERMHLIAAENLDAIRDNILQSDFGLEIVYGNYLEMRKDKIGGYYIDVKCYIEGRPFKKRILLCGYSRRNDWKKILGKNFGVILVDEVNNADKQFIDECFARQGSVNNPLTIWTLNGDDPTHFIYQDYINRCNPLFNPPAEILAEMVKAKKEKGWYYIHFTMRDNPSMNEIKISRMTATYPVGSYYHTIKILGLRGSHGKMIYLDYMSPDRHIKDLDFRDYNHFGIGVDIGATRAFNSFTLGGFKYDFSKTGFLDNYSFEQCGYKKKTENLIAFIKPYYDKLNLRYVSIDSAELNYISDLRTILKPIFPRLEVIESYKATIKQRVDLMIIMLSHDLVEFNNTAAGKEIYDAFRVAKYSENINELREDKNLKHNDIIDSGEYLLTRHMHAILQAGRKNIKRLVA